MEMHNSPWPEWKIVKLIGRGSFGAVYEIERDVLGDIEKGALKVISIPQNDSDIEELSSDGYDDESITSAFQSHLKSIVAEYTLMKKMSGSSNIVNCDNISYVQHEDGIGWDIFIKMELLTPLHKVVTDNIPVETVIKVGEDICAALELCKKFDIVHRDIKPQNIFVSDLGDYKLGDFGIAKTVEKTTGGTKTGTYKYMAPEVYNNQPYGAASDIYSLGLVLYWLLNERRMPFLPLPPVKQTLPMESAARERRFSGEPIPAPAHGSPELKAIVLKACAYDPKQRYTSAAEMRADLRGLGEEAIPVPTAIPKEAPTPVVATPVVATPVVPVVSAPEVAPKPATIQTSNSGAKRRVQMRQDASGNWTTTEVMDTPVAVVAAQAPDSCHEVKPNKKSRHLVGFCAVLTILCVAVILLWPINGEWSEWSAVIPDDTEDRKIESMEQYRYRNKVLVESENAYLEEGILVGKKEKLSDYSDWSEWQIEPVEESDYCKVERQTRYRSRNMTAVDSWSKWSSWSDWSTASANKSDSCDVKTRMVYSYEAYRYCCKHCGMFFAEIKVNMVAHSLQHGVSDGAVNNLYSVLKGKQPESLSRDQILADAGYSYQSTTLYGIDAKLAVDTSSSPYSLNDGGSTWYTSSSNPSQSETQYSTRTRKLVKTEAWSDWSAYTSEPLYPDKDTEVEQQVQYRFCTRKAIAIYEYEVWGEWGAWKDTQEKVSAAQEQDKRIIYRYANRSSLWKRLFHSAE